MKHKKSHESTSSFLIFSWSLLFSSFEQSGIRLSSEPRDFLNGCSPWRMLSPVFNLSHLWTNLSFSRSTLFSYGLVPILASTSVFDGHGLSRSQRRVSRAFFRRPYETKIHHEKSTPRKTKYTTFILTKALVRHNCSYLPKNTPAGTGFFLQSSENPLAPPCSSSS